MLLTLRLINELVIEVAQANDTISEVAAIKEIYNVTYYFNRISLLVLFEFLFCLKRA